MVLPPQETSLSIGPILTAARERAGLSVEDVANQLRMRQTLVRAVESEDFAACGGAVYARGHIRSIAKLVGIDADPLVHEFDERFGNPAEVLTDTISDGPSLLTPEKKLPWNTIVGAAVFVLLAIAGVSVFNGSASSPVAVPSVSTTPSESATPSPSESAIAQAPAGAVTLVVTADKGSSWLSVRNDAGDQLFQTILRRGSSMSFQDQTRLRVVIGNAGALTLKVNGKDMGAPGAEGEVLNLEFTPQD